MFDETNIFALLKDKYVLPKKVKLFESFAGIGCQRMAFNRLGIDVEMVGISEIDKYAIQSYMAIHGETKNFGDITKINGNDLPQIDVFTYSFPCTDLSRAGSMKGLSKDTRSGLVYEVLRILHELDNVNRLPKVLIMENVVDLIQVKFIKQFQEIQLELEQLGYSNYTETMNAKDYGVAQNRDRVFMVSILGDYYYEFPKPFKLEKRLKDYLETSVDEKYYLSEKAISGLNRADMREHTPTWLNDESSESPCIDTRVGALTHWSPYVKENERYIQWDNTGKGHNSQAWRAYHTDGNICTISASNSNGDKTQIIEPTICDFRYDEGFRSREEDDISPTLPSTHLGTSSMSGQPFVREPYIVDDTYKNRDERVYENCSPTIRSEREGLKVVEPSIIVKENNSTGYDVAIEGDCININQPNSKTRRGRVGHQVSQTLTTQQELVVVESSTAKSELCNKMLETGLYQECDMIRHSYTNDRMEYTEKRTENSEDNNISACMTTRSDTLGIVVNNGGLRIRKLTPLECWRLMGIDDNDFNKASQVCSNSQLYKQAGNGIVVDVFAAILNQMKGD